MLTQIHMDVLQYSIGGNQDVVLSDDDFDALKEIQDIITKHGYQDRFGVSLLSRAFNLQANEDILEITDDVKRTSVWRVVPSDSPLFSQGGILETNWEFERDSQEVHAGKCRVVKCHYDHGHKRIHIWL